MLPVLLLASFVAICSAQGTSYNVNISAAEIIQPVRVISCPPDISVVCEISLSVSTMQTLTAYSVNNGARGDSGYQVRVNDNGDLEVYPEATSSSLVTELFQPIIADGNTQRNLLVVNDQLPGPTLIGYNGQRVRINVTNNLGSEAITLHWHGQHVNGSSGSNQYSDGVPYVTQCPIFPGNSFVYDYVFYPGGTYWYHSHMYDERSNGVYGALVVLDPPGSAMPGDPIDSPADHTISLFEWFPVNSDTWLEAPFTTPDLADPSQLYSHVDTYDGTSTSGVQFFAGFMNSNGWRFAPGVNNCVNRGGMGNPLPQDCTGPLNPYPLPSFEVASGSSYRFRLIGSQVTYAYRFSIAGHRLRVVATDGFDAMVPQNNGYVDFIIIHVGERYDFVIDADQPSDNYLIVFETLEEPSLLIQNCYCIKAHRGYAILTYNDSLTPPSDVDPGPFVDSYNPLERCNAGNPCFALNCPFESYPADLYTTCINVQEMVLTSPGGVIPSDEVTESIFLNFGFNNGPSINDRSFLLPTAPPLSQPYTSESEADFCQYAVLQAPLGPAPTGSPDPIDTTRPTMCTHTYTVPGDVDGVEMVYTNVASGEPHPVHLHGHHYFVLEIGYPIYNADGTVNTTSPALNCDADNGTCAIGVRWNPGYPVTPACMQNNSCPLKDTVIVPFGGWVRVRFPRNNWGWWIMHCHIEPHLLGGMAMVINETSVAGDFPVPMDFPTCGNFNNEEMIGTTADPNPAISQEEAMTYRDVMIALAVVSFVLLIALIVVVFLLLAKLCCSRGKVAQEPSHGMEMKTTSIYLEQNI